MRNPRRHVDIFLIILGVHVNILFFVKVNILTVDQMII